MSKPIVDEPLKGRYVMTSGEGHWLTDETQLLAVSEVGLLAPLPLCGAALQGVLTTQYGPLALLAPGVAAGHVPALAALVQTNKGPLALAVDHVARLDQPPPANSGLLTAHMQSLTTEFALAQEPQAKAQGVKDTADQVRFLLINIGQDVQVAVRASRVSRLERCQDLRPVVGVSGGHQIVQAGDQFLHAQHLSHLLGRVSHTASASWCLQVQGAAGSTAVLVDEIAGSVQAPAQAIRTVMVAGQPTQWLIRPDHAPLEIVLEDERDLGASQSQDQRVDEASETLAATCQALRVDVGPYAVVLGQDLLGPVMGELTVPVSPRRTQAQNVRVWHLDRLLGLQTVSAPTHALLIQLAGHRVVLLCDRIQPLTSLQSFAPVPTLPKNLAGLLHGIRVVDGTAQLMLSSQPSRAALRALLRQHLRAARAGWIAPVWNPKEKRTDHAQ